MSLETVEKPDLIASSSRHGLEVEDMLLAYFLSPGATSWRLAFLPSVTSCSLACVRGS